MNILIFDQTKDNGPIDYMQPLIDHISHLDAVVFSSLEEAQLSAKENPFDYMIIDFSTKEGNIFLQYILEHFPKQKIITLSSELISSNENCEECRELHNKRRLIKPVDPINIFKTLKNFDTNPCKYVNHFLEPKILLEDLLQRYDYYSYNKKESIISKEEHFNDYILKEYIDLVNHLKHYNIEHEILDDYAIRIC